MSEQQPALNSSGVITEDQPGAVVERVGTGSLQCYAEVAVAPSEGRWYSSLSVQASHTGWSSPMVPRYAFGFDDMASAKADAVARVAKWLRGNMKSPDNGVRVAARKLLDLMAGRWPDELLHGPRRGWYRTPGGIIVHCNGNGFYCVQTFDTPVAMAELRTKEQRRQCWPWVFHPFTVHQTRFDAFLARCEYLGSEAPAAAINEQVARIARLKAPAADAAPAPAPIGQLELFA